MKEHKPYVHCMKQQQTWPSVLVNRGLKRKKWFEFQENWAMKFKVTGCLVIATFLFK